MKKLALVFFALAALFAPGLALCQSQGQGLVPIDKAVSPEALWLAYLEKEPTTDDIYNQVYDDTYNDKVEVYKEFAAVEILRRGDHKMSMLARMIVYGSDLVQTSAWEIYKRKASDEEFHELLGRLDSAKDRCKEFDDFCRKHLAAYAQDIIDILQRREEHEKYRRDILIFAPRDTDRERAAQEIFANHPTDYQLSDILAYSPILYQKDRVLEIIRSRKDFDKNALRHAFWGLCCEKDSVTATYTRLIDEIYTERFGDITNFHDNAPISAEKPKINVLGLDALQGMEAGDLLRLMGKSPQ
jgi:hypothetical protein